jgi:hypothetical protein
LRSWADIGIAAAYLQGTGEGVGTREVEPEHGYGWLGAVIPADAKRFRVADKALAAVLTEAGAELVGARPDVEIAPIPKLRGDAALSIAVLGTPPRPGRPFPVRVLRRLVASLLVRLQAWRARRVLRRLGQTQLSTALWDHETPVRSTVRQGHLRARLIERFPQRALVIAASAPRTRTLFDEVLAAAGRATGAGVVAAGRPSVRAELLIADTNAGILRIAVGAGRDQIARQNAALASLRGTDLPAVVRDRLPRILASDRCGICDWALESKLAGSRPGAALSGTLRHDCVDFLVALHSVNPTAAEPGSLRDQADVVVKACTVEEEEVVRTVANRLELELAGLPRGFVHGDFFHGNLLEKNGRLTAVIDWDSAGPGRLPVVDLLHLQHVTDEFADVDWGPRLVERLLPWARAGGDDVVHAYSEQLGLSIDAEQLEALVLAYWLDYVSFQLKSHPHRFEQARWLDANVRRVVQGLADDEILRRKA